jgi:pimeloyl-ACP methyl ester carboxylesterase
VLVARNVPFMRRQACPEFVTGCVNVADVYYPSNPGNWPTVVTVHGRPRTPRDMAPLARALARRGTVVFNIDYRGVRPVSKGFPEAVDDVACALRFARQRAGRYGGSGKSVVLVGHSQGAYVGALVALAGNTFRGNRRACLATRGSRLPDGFVSVAGVSGVHDDYRIDQIWFGGTRQQLPDAWRRGTVYTHIGRNPDLVVGIIFERNDPVLGDGHATSLHRALDRAGYRCRLVMLDDGDSHFDILDPRTTMGRRVVKLVRGTIRRSARR